jgi:hypothetical protein
LNLPSTTRRGMWTDDALEKTMDAIERTYHSPKKGQQFTEHSNELYF